MSVPQNVATVTIFDYVIDTSGKAVTNTTVHCLLEFNQSTTTSPPTSIGPLQQTTTTDTNGYYQFNVVANANLSPSGSTYLISTAYNSYAISVPTGAGPFQTTGLIVNTPTLPPIASTITGPLTINNGPLTVVNNGANITGATTITGAETVTAGLTVSGGGSNITGGETVAGGLMLAGLLTMSDAAARLVPGATSWSKRNHANSQDDLIVLDGGNTTVAGTLTAGNSTLGTLSATAVTLSGRLTTQADRAVSTQTASSVSGSFTPNPAAGEIHILNLSGNVSIQNVTSPVTGQLMVIQFNQDATGGRTATWGTQYADTKWQPSPIANSSSRVYLYFGGTLWRAVSGPAMDAAANLYLSGHLLVTGTAPTLGSLQTGISAQSIAGNDVRGTVAVTTSSAVTINSPVAVVTFATANASTPVVMVTDQGTSSSTGSFVARSVSTTGFTLFTSGGGSSLSNTTVYTIGYMVCG